MRYQSRKGTTINIPDGLTDKQIKDIKADADAGYGTRAQETANSLGKGSGAPKGASSRDLDDQIKRTKDQIAKSPNKATPGLSKRLTELLVQKNGGPPATVNTGKGAGSDPSTGGGDASGPTVPGSGQTGESVDTFLKNIFDKFQPLDLSGTPKQYTEDEVKNLRQTTQDSLYAEDTKYLDRNRARSMEETQQTLANRGIPYDPAAAQDPNSKNLYGRTIGAIEENYRGEQQSALNRARTGADERTASAVSTSEMAAKGYRDTKQAEYSSQLDAMTSGTNLVNTLMTKYGIDQATAQNMVDNETQKKLAKEQNRTAIKIAKIGKQSSGGGGGSGGGGEAPGGFELPT